MPTGLQHPHGFLDDGDRIIHMIHECVGDDRVEGRVREVEV
jgi:hypothetical protein